MSKTTTLHVHHTFLYISLPLLHNYAEMPTSRDLKSGDCFFFHYPPPEFQPPLLSEKIDPVPNVNDFGHYMTSYMMHIFSKFEIIVLMLEIIFVNE